jgi:hypothetical protein
MDWMKKYFFRFSTQHVEYADISESNRNNVSHIVKYHVILGEKWNKMKKKSFTMLTYLVVSLLVSGLALAVAGAIKVPIQKTTDMSPAPGFASVVSDTLHKGKVMVNFPKGSNNVQFTIVLSGATPNSVYYAQFGPKSLAPSGWFGGLSGSPFGASWAGLGTIITDANGDGSLHINVQVDPGTYDYWICICKFSDASLTTHQGCPFVADIPSFDIA